MVKLQTMALRRARKDLLPEGRVSTLQWKWSRILILSELEFSNSCKAYGLVLLSNNMPPSYISDLYAFSWEVLRGLLFMLSYRWSNVSLWSRTLVTKDFQLLYVQLSMVRRPSLTFVLNTWRSEVEPSVGVNVGGSQFLLSLKQATGRVTFCLWPPMTNHVTFREDYKVSCAVAC